MQKYSRKCEYLKILKYTLLANYAYDMNQMIIPSYKFPTIKQLINKDFNYDLAKAQVTNKHCITILKELYVCLEKSIPNSFNQ